MSNALVEERDANGALPRHAATVHDGLLSVGGAATHACRAKWSGRQSYQIPSGSDGLCLVVDIFSCTLPSTHPFFSATETRLVFLCC